MTSFRGILGQSWNSEISAILPNEILEFNFDLKILWNYLVIFPVMKKLRDLKKVSSNLEPGHCTSCLLLLGPFYTIQTNLMYFFAHDCMYSTCVYFLGKLANKQHNVYEMSIFIKLLKYTKATRPTLNQCFKPSIMNEWKNEWMRLNCVYPLLAGNPCIFLSHPIKHPSTISALN